MKLGVEAGPAQLLDGDEEGADPTRPMGSPPFY